MEARFEMGEVLLTARIFEVLSQFCFRVVPRYLALTNQVREAIPGSPCEFGCLAERQDALCIKRKGKLNPQARLHLRHGQPKAAGDGLRYVEMQGHRAYQFPSILQRTG